MAVNLEHDLGIQKLKGQLKEALNSMKKFGVLNQEEAEQVCKMDVLGHLNQFSCLIKAKPQDQFRLYLIERFVQTSFNILQQVQYCIASQQAIAESAESPQDIPQIENSIQDIPSFHKQEFINSDLVFEEDELEQNQHHQDTCTTKFDREIHSNDHDHVSTNPSENASLLLDIRISKIKMRESFTENNLVKHSRSATNKLQNQVIDEVSSSEKSRSLEQTEQIEQDNEATAVESKRVYKTNYKYSFDQRSVRILDQELAAQAPRTKKEFMIQIGEGKIAIIKKQDDRLLVRCTLKRNRFFNECNALLRSRKVARTVKKPQNMYFYDWFCTACYNINYNFRSKCSQCDKIKDFTDLIQVL